MDIFIGQPNKDCQFQHSNHKTFLPRFSIFIYFPTLFASKNKLLIHKTKIFKLYGQNKIIRCANKNKNIHLRESIRIMLAAGQQKLRFLKLC